MKTGTNTIDRSSHESIFVVPDETPSDVLYKKLVTSLEGGETFKYSTQPYGFPDRLILPRGTKDGMPYNLLIMVSPVDESNIVHIESPIWGRITSDGRPMGFPLDRPLNPLVNVPNMHVTEVLVHHRDVEELNATV